MQTQTTAGAIDWQLPRASVAREDWTAASSWSGPSDSNSWTGPSGASTWNEPTASVAWEEPTPAAAWD